MAALEKPRIEAQGTGARAKLIMTPEPGEGSCQHNSGAEAVLHLNVVAPPSKSTRHALAHTLQGLTPTMMLMSKAKQSVATGSSDSPPTHPFAPAGAELQPVPHPRSHPPLR